MGCSAWLTPGRGYSAGRQTVSTPQQQGCPTACCTNKWMQRRQRGGRWARRAGRSQQLNCLHCRTPRFPHIHTQNSLKARCASHRVDRHPAATSGGQGWSLPSPAPRLGCCQRRQGVSGTGRASCPCGTVCETVQCAQQEEWGLHQMFRLSYTDEILSCSCRLSDHAGMARLLLLPGLWLLPLPLRLCLQAANAAQACCQSSGARARATASITEAVKRSREMMLPGELPRSLPSELLQSSRAQQTSEWSKRKTGQHSIQQCRPQPQVGCAAAQQQHRGSRRRT